MKLPLLLASLSALLSLAAASAPAAAQNYGYGNGGTLRCESNDNRQRVCNTGWRSATLVRQLSDTRCIEGRNWGSNNGSIWVNGGCRGEFAEGRGGWGAGGGNWNGGNAGTIRCESNDNRQRVCNTGWRGGATLVRQLSDTRCIEGRNWGSNNGSIWVNGGCRGEFAEGRGGWGNGGGNWNGGNAGTIRCESSDNRQRVCNTGWRSATLVRQLSKTQCVEGRNWGSSNGSVWVNGGCRGEFTEGRGHGNGWGSGGRWDNGNPNYTVECASSDNRMRTCNWDRRQGRPVIVQQLSKTQCVEGRNWGYSGSSLWVNAGCRARFGSR